MTASSDELVRRLVDRFEAARDPAAAESMAAYMRNQFPFLGIPTPPRAPLMRDALAGIARPDEADLIDASAALWNRDEREYQYAACWLLDRHRKALTPAFMPTAESLITTKSWWDTIDALAIKVIGTIVHSHRELESVMDDWLVSDDFWLARSSILHQLGWKADTDPDVLFAACLARAGDAEFFLRKAIGWALRSYSYVDPRAVEQFVREHDRALSGLSTREALRAIDRKRRQASKS